MQTLAQMKIAELKRLIADVDRAIRRQEIAGRPFVELASFRAAIDDELIRRGA